MVNIGQKLVMNNGRQTGYYVYLGMRLAKLVAVKEVSLVMIDEYVPCGINVDLPPESKDWERVDKFPWEK